MIELSRSLILRYDPGQFTFNNFNHAAADAALYDLAEAMNEFQTDNLRQVVLQTRTQLF